jgi:hypothetical protein
MDLLSQLSFASPLALWALLSLPVIWWLLRFVPPRPQLLKFPPVRILLGLDPKTETPDTMPWWLMLLRLALAAFLIGGLALPFLSKGTQQSFGGHTLVVFDDGWAAAKDWKARQDYLTSILQQAQRDNGLVSLVSSSRGLASTLNQVAAQDALERVAALEPSSLTIDRVLAAKALADIKSPDQVIWLSDGLGATGFAQKLKETFGKSAVTVALPKSDNLPLALSQLRRANGDIQVDVLSVKNSLPRAVSVQARAANGRVLLEQSIDTAAGANAGAVTLQLPTELRNELQSIVVAEAGHAGARQLLDDGWRRKTVAMLSSTASETAQPLLAPLYYVERALQPFADVRQPKSIEELQAAFDAGLSMLVLADIGVMPQQDVDAIKAWVEKGGLLLRFAGPRMAASPSNGLEPVNLREGGRELGSALSWEEPQKLQAFSDKSPFAGLLTDERATVRQQVLAVPDTELADRTWASLADGTPLVTGNRMGKGLVVLFHVTAGPEWSGLPLTGLFVDMLKRIVDVAPSAGSLEAAKLVSSQETSAYAPRLVLNGKGELVTPYTGVKSIAAADMEKTKVSFESPPGLYARGDVERAVNLDIKPADMVPVGALPPGVAVTGFEPPERLSIAHYALLGAFLLFIGDCLARLLMEGRSYVPASAAALVMVFALSGQATDALAGAEEDAMKAALETRIAYVRTGNSEIDDVSDAGLKGLGFVVNDRTSVVLADPAGVEIENDEIVYYPLLYWPIDGDAKEPSDAAARKIEAYMRNGGTIFFDLREDGLGADALRDDVSANGAALRRILSKLDVPPLDTVAEKHVLTRSFYLLDTFPGRFTGGPLWVEAPDAEARTDPGTADGVSGIIIGSNDYAGAWAMDATGNAMFAVVPGDDRQREFAFRVGVNVVMYALTGNYKADQVHVPALLERLGQ